MARSVATVVMIAATAAGGCAVGQQISYNTPMLRLQVPGSGSLALAVQDGRDEVRSGAKPPTFCGLLRSGFGIPYSVTTASGRPLATDLAYAISRGLTARGFRVAIVPTTPGQAATATVQAFATQRADRSLLVQIADWKSDTQVNTTLNYQVTAQLRDGQSRVIAQSQITGNDNLGGDFMDPGGHMQQAVPAAARERLERLLNDPAITKALQGSPAPVPPPDPQPPSVAPAS